MPPKRASPSASPEPDDDGAKPTKQVSTLPENVLNAMQAILNYVYDYRNADGHDPSKLFHRKVSKRIVPDYYDVIKEPVALSTIKQKLFKKEYLSVKDYVRDWALVVHNAQVYNLPESGAYQDALVVKHQLDLQFQALVQAGVLAQEDTEWPYLGEIPAADAAAEDEDDEDDEDDDEDDEVEEEVNEEEVPKKRGRGRPRKSSIVIKRDSIKKEKDDNDDPDGRKKRGRPPKVLTPLEGRIQAMLKGIRKPKGSTGQAIILDFERLPDKQAMPEYWREIKEPIAYEQIKRKFKRKKYSTFDQFMKDLDLMFDNARQYNEDESNIHKDAVLLQSAAHKMAEEVRARPDSEFAGDESKIPMPEGILHNGELYKTGDWVLVQNANDLSKPIPSQIYRTYQDAQGAKWVNVCWYYRPEQTVHRFDKHFLEGEVVKTGQYRDHRIDEIVGRCFVMFITRYFKGRPANLSPDTDVFVCESRYNEEKHSFNKIKTWASCLPDEVRDKDYAMEPFAVSRKYKKYPSPIAYLLKDDQKETDDFPKAEWGAENAPPKIGGVHKRPRDPRDSPPPEPTPPPPPTPPAPVQRMPEQPPQARYAPLQASQTPGVEQQTRYRPTLAARESYPNQLAHNTPTPLAVIAARPYNAQQQAYTPATPAGYQTPASAYLRPASSHQAPPTNAAPQQQSTSSIPANPYQRADANSAASYRGPPPIETYVLPDHANSQIPYEIRSLYQTDDAGRVLFFTTPPVYVEDSTPRSLDISSRTTIGERNADAEPTTTLLGHSARYLASKLRRREEIESRRADYEREKETQRELKRKRAATEDKVRQEQIGRLKRAALERLSETLAGDVQADLRALHGQDWKSEGRRVVEVIAAHEEEAERRQAKVALIAREREQRSKIMLSSSGGFFE